MDKTPSNEFVPMEVVEYHEERGMTLERILQAFHQVFGIPKGVVSTAFRNRLKEVLSSEYPNLRCSTARAILEGRIPGIPIPAPHSQMLRRKSFIQAIYLLDLMETMLYLYLEETIADKDISIRNEVALVKKTFGTTKLPRLMQSVLGLEQGLKKQRLGGQKLKDAQKKRLDTHKPKEVLDHAKQNTKTT